MTSLSDTPPQARAFPVSVPRHAFGPLLIPRAGVVWRAMQDVVVDQSSSVGWSPGRYVAANTMFVVRSMTVVHAAPVPFGVALVGHTWPSRERRQMLFTRQVRLHAGSTLVAAATQEWAYLSRELTPIRAGQDLFEAFELLEGYPEVSLPARTPLASPPPSAKLELETWHTWMDPHAHVNHTAYIDFCDEAVARVVAAEDLDPQRLEPIAETVHFKAAIGPRAPVVVETTFAAMAGAARVFTHRLTTDGTVCATAVTVRGLRAETSLKQSVGSG